MDHVLCGNVIDHKYKVMSKIGSGAFGTIYMGEDIDTGEKVAIKIEKNQKYYSQLMYESKIYSILRGGNGIPLMKYFGTEKGINVLVIDLLGKSLEQLFIDCHRSFTVKTILMLADQILDRLEYFHSKNFIHRDIKPENFLMGLKSNWNKLYLIDYGLAKKYRDPRTSGHIPYKEGKKLTGTARYASINTHAGIEQSRRDDLESVGYMLVYFYNGCLPWQGLKAATKAQKYEKISEIKISYPLSLLCKHMPPTFVLYLSHCRSLQFAETPNYAYLRDLFRYLVLIKLNLRDSIINCFYFIVCCANSTIFI